jgi:hypothetical protein
VDHLTYCTDLNFKCWSIELKRRLPIFPGRSLHLIFAESQSARRCSPAVLGSRSEGDKKWKLWAFAAAATAANGARFYQQMRARRRHCVCATSVPYYILYAACAAAVYCIKTAVFVALHAHHDIILPRGHTFFHLCVCLALMPTPWSGRVFVHTASCIFPPAQQSQEREIPNEVTIMIILRLTMCWAASGA